MLDVKPGDILPLILAGGEGTRLRPLTLPRCKPAVFFAGEFRIIDFTLLNCIRSGLRRVYILTQYRPETLARHCAERWGCFRTRGGCLAMLPPRMGGYRGTADAVFKNLGLLGAHRPRVVLILSGDHIYRGDYRRMIRRHLRSGADVTVLSDTVGASEAHSFGVMETSGGRIVRFVEKPSDPWSHARGGRCDINLGVYCFRPRFLAGRLIDDAGSPESAHDFGRDILPVSIHTGKVMPFPLRAVSADPRPYWRDVGSIDSYFRAHQDLLTTPPRFSLRDTDWPPGSRPGLRPRPLHSSMPRWNARRAGCRNIISASATIENANIERSVISRHVHVASGADLRECILFPGAHVGGGARLRRVIVEEGARVPPGARVGWEPAGGDETAQPLAVSVIVNSSVIEANPEAMALTRPRIPVP